MQNYKKNIGYNIISNSQIVDIEKKKEKIDEIKKYFSKIQVNLINNCIFYKDFSFKFYKTFFNSSSPCIIKSSNLKNKYIMNTRIVNYKLDSIGKSNNYNKCITINKISILDNFFNEVDFKYFFPKNSSSKYIGVEDIRLLDFNNELYFIGSLYNPENNKVQIVSNKFKNFENPTIINPTFETSFNWEKNWVFFNNKNNINIIYKWYPLYICNIDYLNNSLNLIKSIENLPDVFKNFRGSTNGIIYNEKIWFIVHEQNKNIKSYLHCFVVFNKNMDLLGYSKEFNFENNLVEFCLGFELSYNNNFIITYSTLDSTTKLAIFLPEYINSLINYI